MGRTKQTAKKVQIGKYTQELPSGEQIRVECFKGMSSKGSKKRNAQEPASPPVPPPGKKAQRTGASSGAKVQKTTGAQKKHEEIVFLNGPEVNAHFKAQGLTSGVHLNSRVHAEDQVSGGDDNIQTSGYLFQAATVRADDVKWFIVAKEDGPTVFICRAKVTSSSSNIIYAKK